MFGLSTTAIMGAFSAITGFVMKFLAQRTQLKAQEEKMKIEMMTTSHEQRMEMENLRIRAMDVIAKNEVTMSRADPTRSTTRRVLAYIVIGALCMIPTLSDIHTIEWFVFTTDQIKHSGFFGIGSHTETVHGVHTASGVPYMWMTVIAELAVMIVSFYVGQSAGKIAAK